MSVTHAWAAEIVKSERDEAGDLIVYGKATGPDLDLDGQICDPKWLKKAMPEWFTFGNIREMHGPIAAGIGIELSPEGDDWMLKSKCIDPSTARKIEAGVLKGYSVGIRDGRVTKDAAAPGGRIVGGKIVEVSYVDRPCNPTAKMAIAKMSKSAETLEAVEAVPAADDSSRTATDDKGSAGGTVPGVVESAKDDDRAQPGGSGADVIAADSGEAAPADAVESAEKSLARGVGRTILAGLKTLKYRGEAPVLNKAATSQDIASAEACMSAIGALVASEAQGLIDGLQCEAYQIETLLRAYNALVYFCALEASEPEEEGAIIEVIALADQPADLITKNKTDPEPTATETEQPTDDSGTKVAALEAEVNTLRAQMAKVLAQPVPGGPVLARSTPDIEKADGRALLLTKAAEYDRLAADMSAMDPVAAKGFRELAAAARAGL